MKSWGARWAWPGPLGVSGPSRCTRVQAALGRGGERESFCAPCAPPPPDPSTVPGLRPQVGEGTAEHNGPELSQERGAGRARARGRGDPRGSDRGRASPIAAERSRSRARRDAGVPRLCGGVQDGDKGRAGDTTCPSDSPRLRGPGCAARGTVRPSARPSALAQRSAETWRRQRSSGRTGGGAWPAGARPGDSEERGQEAGLPRRQG